jgi:hypothetical protein
VTWRSCASSFWLCELRCLQRGIAMGISIVGRCKQCKSKPIERFGSSTDWSSPKVDELHHDVRVSLGYADIGKNGYVAVTGSGRLMRDGQSQESMEHRTTRLLSPRPRGRTTRFAARRYRAGGYCIAPGRISYIVAAVAAAVTGTPAGLAGNVCDTFVCLSDK